MTAVAIVARAALLLSCLPPSTMAATHHVGPRQAHLTIEAAHDAAAAGDTILVHPRPGNEAYPRVALRVTVARLTIRAAPAGQTRVPLSGEGFDYSGRGAVPRAIVQFDPGADGGVLEGFRLYGAHNDSHNGAGVRINQASQVTVRDCEIDGNDMGIMSNGDGSPASAAGQRIVGCVIHHNGDPTRPGYNHNLYLGGASVLLSACEVHSSLTGHNVKSRAHRNWIEYSYIHDSANRELDLVDDDVTARPGSHTVLLGNLIVKARPVPGNHEVIHFGQDIGGRRDGALVLIHNTVVTPYAAAVVHLSSPAARLRLHGNLIDDAGAGAPAQVLVRARAGADVDAVSGSQNWFAHGFASQAGALGTVAAAGSPLPFVDPAAADYRLARPVAGVTGAGTETTAIEVPAMGDVRPPAPLLARQYRHPAATAERRDAVPDLGAFSGAP